MKRFLPGLGAALIAAGVLAADGGLGAGPGPEHLSHGRFKDVAIYRPQGPVKDVVLFLSGDGGWNLGVIDMARALVAEGALVAGVSVPQFYAALEADPAACVYPDGDLENLSHFVQGHARLDTYLTPLLVGYSSGATMAYAMLAQAPAGTFGGGLSLGFCPDLGLRKPLCPAGQLRITPGKDREHTPLLAPAALPASWITLQGESDQVCDAGAVGAFVAQAPGAAIVRLPKVGHGFSVARNWMPQFIGAYRRLASARANAAPPPPSLTGLPLVEVPAPASRDTFAVMLSGDGGWAGLDRDVAGALARSGIPVVGLDSLRYFWTPRTPGALAADLDRVVRFYASRWGKARVALIGYSQGADVLPFAVNRLPPDSRARVAQVVLIGPGRNAAFEFHLGNWLPGAEGDQPILPEVRKLGAGGVLCLYGDDDADTLCRDMPATDARALPGGHHFGGDFERLAALILAELSGERGQP